MAKELSHEEIAERFLQSEALNFQAMGKFVSEVGPELLVRDNGWHGVNFGRFNLLACMLTASDAVRLIGNLRVASQVAAAMDARAEGD
jgi:hypothetical protein